MGWAAPRNRLSLTCGLWCPHHARILRALNRPVPSPGHTTKSPAGEAGRESGRRRLFRLETRLARARYRALVGSLQPICAVVRVAVVNVNGVPRVPGEHMVRVTDASGTAWHHHVAKASAILPPNRIYAIAWASSMPWYGAIGSGSHWCAVTRVGQTLLVATCIAGDRGYRPIEAPSRRMPDGVRIRWVVAVAEYFSDAAETAAIWPLPFAACPSGV